MPQKNEELRLQITECNNLGFGVARHGGMVIFVQGGVDGDVADCRVIHTAKTYAVAKIVTLVTPSPYREAANCPAPSCGGCAYRGMTREHEIACKEARVKNAFRQAGLGGVTVLPLLDTGVRYGYRNKAQYPVQQGKDGHLLVGFYAPKSHRVIEASDCPLQDERFAPIVKAAKELCEEYRIPAYDEKTKAGLLRHFYLRIAPSCGEVLFVFVVNGKSLPHEEEIASRLMAACPSLVGVVLNENEEDTNVVCGERYRTLRGKDVLTDTLCGVRLQVSPASFYQVNRDAAQLLYRKGAELCAFHGGETVLDLFCGVGSIGLSMAQEVKEIIGVEVIESAVLCAKENAARNGIQNASFYCADATDTEHLLSLAEKERGARIHPDAVILDPPRKGCSEELLSYLLRLAPEKILYISCNPDTLARDAARLSSRYDIGAVTPVDLFPGTGHVESVVLLSRTEK